MASVDLHIQGDKPLEYKKDVLVQALQDELEKRETARQEAKDKAAAKQKASVDRITAAMDNPQFVVWLVSIIRANGYDIPSPSEEAFVTWVADRWPETDGEGMSPERDPDADIKRLIRMYEKAEGDTFEVTVKDDVAKFL